jgi:hypothetical protein
MIAVVHMLAELTAVKRGFAMYRAVVFELERRELYSWCYFLSIRYTLVNPKPSWRVRILISAHAKDMNCN